MAGFFRMRWAACGREQERSEWAAMECGQVISDWEWGGIASLGSKVVAYGQMWGEMGNYPKEPTM